MQGHCDSFLDDSQYVPVSVNVNGYRGCALHWNAHDARAHLQLAGGKPSVGDASPTSAFNERDTGSSKVLQATLQAVRS